MNAQTGEKECEMTGGTATKKLVPMISSSVYVTHNRGLNLASTMNEHAHPMSRRLVARTVVGQNK
jgi:hypothetical protein